MKLFVAAVQASDWLKLGLGLEHFLLCGIAGVDIRIASLDHGLTKAEIELARIVSEAGLELRCHSWLGHRSGDSAQVDGAMGLRDGRLAGQYTLCLGAKSFGCNAERDVWRGERGHAHPNAVEYLQRFNLGFREQAITRPINYVGLADPRYHYRPADLDGDGVNDAEIPLRLREEYQRVGVMAYQSRLDHIQRVLARAEKRWPEHKGRIVPWLGVGRVGDAGVVGNAEASTVIARQYGEVTFYVGFGAIGQLLEGHAQHPPLVQLIPQILAPEASA